MSEEMKTENAVDNGTEEAPAPENSGGAAGWPKSGGCGCLLFCAFMAMAGLILLIDAGKSTSRGFIDFTELFFGVGYTLVGIAVVGIFVVLVRRMNPPKKPTDKEEDGNG